MKNLLVATAGIEAGAGIALMGFPSEVTDLLLGSTSDGTPPLMIVRAVGTVLFALGIACWFGSRDMQKPCARRLVAVMTAYNLCAALALGVVGMKVLSPGILLWPAAALHAAMAVWCVVCLLSRPSLATKEADRE